MWNHINNMHNSFKFRLLPWIGNIWLLEGKRVRIWSPSRARKKRPNEKYEQICPQIEDQKDKFLIEVAYGRSNGDTDFRVPRKVGNFKTIGAWYVYRTLGHRNPYLIVIRLYVPEGCERRDLEKKIMCIWLLVVPVGNALYVRVVALQEKEAVLERTRC